jgi:EmrB/QacA subfamily drug resistance transporter
VTDTKPTPTATAGARGARRHAHPGLVLVIIAGAQLMVVLDGTIVNVALPSMGAYFQRNQTDMTWALNAYSLAFGGLLLLGGRSSDILGRRRMFIIGLFLFSAGSFLAGIAVNFSMLVVGRVVQGMGGAISSPTALSLIANEFKEARERVRALAVYAAVSGAGAAIGLLLGGVFTSYFSWRWVLFVNVPIGAVLITGAFLYVHQTERLKGRFDVLGALLSMAGMVSLVYGFIHVAHDGWGNTETLVVFTAAVVLLVSFVLFEAYGTSSPMMPMRIFENRNRRGTYLVMLVVGAAMFGMFFFITFFIQGVREYSALKTGFAFLPLALVIGITSQVVARLLPRFGPKPLIVTGTAVLTVAMLWLSTVNADSSYAGTVLPGLLVMGLALGLLFVPLTATAVSNIADTDAGLASALLNVGQQVGGAIGLSVLATVFATSSKNYADAHQGGLMAAVRGLPGQLPQLVGAKLQSTGSNGLQQTEILSFVNALPANERGSAAGFFAGPYRAFSHLLLAQGSGEAFFAGAMFAVVAILVSVFVIKIKKDELPAHPPAEVPVSV